MNAYINKEEFEKKLRSIRTKYAMDNNLTLTWVVYISIFLAASLLLLGTTLLACGVMVLFLIGLPFAFVEGLIKGVRKYND